MENNTWARADEQEHATPKLSLCLGIFSGKAVPVNALVLL